jgi:ribosomal protein L24
VTIEGVEDKKQKKKKKKATDKWGKIIEPEAPVQEEDGRQFKSNEAEITTNETLMRFVSGLQLHNLLILCFNLTFTEKQNTHQRRTLYGFRVKG